MSKLCAKCEKIVYPTEEVKCLDKSWHKGCFRCWECGMALNMKNYKGYDKKPYCSAHYPQTKATVVVDTPEQQRLARTSQMQSQAVYHADFEKNIRGTITSVTDDPEMKRVKEVANVISQAAYTRRHSNSENADTNHRTNDGYTHGGHGSQENRSGQSPAYSSRPANQYNVSSVAGAQPQRGSAASGRPQNPSSQPQSSVTRPTSANQRAPYIRSAPVYVAMYDYDAQDDDEASFLENDRIILYEMIDEGWMYGVVQRTGHKGMIPANYVELIQ